MDGERNDLRRGTVRTKVEVVCEVCGGVDSNLRDGKEVVNYKVNGWWRAGA